MPELTDRAEGSARRAADSTALETLARVGLIAYGVVHLLIGWLALQVAWGASSENADQSGAFAQLAESPAGPALLWLVAVGLTALAVWQASEAVWGYQSEKDGKRLRKRLGAGGKSVFYLILAFGAARVAMGGGQSSSGSQQDTTRGVLAWSGGQVLVVLAGLAVIAVGVANVRKGVLRKFREEIDTSALPAGTSRGVERIGQVGFIAKGVAMSLVGVLLVYAAVTFDPEKAQGLDGAMRTIAAQPFGRVLLTVVALGFIAFGVFAFLQARYRRM
ncbi:MAG: DUF1206 domain-containing protein [Geodermatophilaceae bacterium]|nr:DUF1206 domain-containing protein [Geodermatophilaceae bacterium]